MIVRSLTTSDLPSILSIQSECYKDVLPESEECLAAKLRLKNAVCLLAEEEGISLAYLLSHPYEDSEVPKLNSILTDRTFRNPVFYIHDLAVSSRGRGLGIGRLLIGETITREKYADFKKINLIAVQGSVPFWVHFGFAVVPGFNTEKLLSYGRDAKFMSLTLP